MPVVDAAKIAKCFMILGIPDDDNPIFSFGNFTLQGARGETVNIEAMRTSVTAALAATSAAQDGLIDTILTEFDKWWLSTEKVFEDGNTKGHLLDIEAKMEVLRKRLSQILAVYFPFGDLDDEVDHRLGIAPGSGGSIVK